LELKYRWVGQTFSYHKTHTPTQEQKNTWTHSHEHTHPFAYNLPNTNSHIYYVIPTYIWKLDIGNFVSMKVSRFGTIRGK
jgi:hypothetical protein